MSNLEYIDGGYFYNDHIELDGEGDEWRINRLQRIIGYAQAQIDQDHSLLNKVSKLNDHEGTLRVYWTSEPTNNEKRAFEKAWDSRIGDGSEVEHEIDL